MVAGKLLILLSVPAQASDDIHNPRFFEYRSGDFINQMVELSFGWFKTLKGEQLAEYNQSIIHALMYAENGQTVRWYRNDASGSATPVMTWPTGSGYCRRMHIQAIAYDTKKTMSATACFDNNSSKWRWVEQ